MKNLKKMNFTKLNRSEMKEVKGGRTLGELLDELLNKLDVDKILGVITGK